MTTSYFLGPTASDVTGQSGDHSLRFDTGTPIAVVLSQTQPAAGTEQSWGVTIAGEPGVRGSDGDYTVKFDLTTGVTGATLRVAVRRINSAGVAQQTSPFTATQEATAGPKTFNLTGISVGAWQAGDRLAVIYELTGVPGAHGNITFEFRVGTTAAETTAPWDVAVPVTVTAVPADASADAPVPAVTAGAAPTVVTAVPADASADASVPAVVALSAVTVVAVSADASADAPPPTVAAPSAATVVAVTGDATADFAGVVTVHGYPWPVGALHWRRPTVRMGG